MEKNYLKISSEDGYLYSTFSYPVQDIYLLEIEEEMDIFSDLPLEVFSPQYGTQMSDVLKLFRQEYIRYISSRKVDAILPKLKYYIDSDGASVIQLSSSWNNGNSSLYFSFEKDEKESSFGMVWNDSLGKNFESRSGNLNLNNINDIIHEIIDFIFKVY